MVDLNEQGSIPMRLPATLTALAAVAIAVVCGNPSAANAYSTGGAWKYASLTSIAGSPNGGAWVQVQDEIWTGLHKTKGHTISWGGAATIASVPAGGSITANASGSAIYIVTPEGKIYRRGASDVSPWASFGEAGYSWESGNPIISAAATPSGNGLWALDHSGRIWDLGDAYYMGDRYIVTKGVASMVGTPSGHGYYIFEKDGGVFTYGDAKFFGWTGGKKPGGHDLTGLALSYDANHNINGYWMVGDDGGVFTYGQATFYGSTGGSSEDRVTNITSLATGGYAIVHEDGAVQPFGPSIRTCQPCHDLPAQPDQPRVDREER